MPDDGLFWHRMQFAFTVTFHYLFQQLAMGLALLIVIFKVVALRTASEHYNDVAGFWARIFGINFAMGATEIARGKHGSDAAPCLSGPAR